VQARELIEPRSRVFQFRSTRRKPEQRVMFRSERRWNEPQVKNACPGGAPIPCVLGLSQSLRRSNRAPASCILKCRCFSGRIELQTQFFHRSRSRLATEQLNTSPVSLLPRRPQPGNCASCGRRSSMWGAASRSRPRILLILYASVLTSVTAAGTILLRRGLIFRRRKGLPHDHPAQGRLAVPRHWHCPGPPEFRAYFTGFA
jgi:hypothetical protein